MKKNKKSGALSKNRTCDSSLPRTCFTTRLLGRLKTKVLYGYANKNQEQINNMSVFLHRA